MNERSIFLAALDINDSACRNAYLDEACGGDADLRRHVEELLQAHGQPQGFMQQPAAAMITTDNPPLTEGPGAVIGAYKLLEQIGEGGFGVVFMAEQFQPIRRRVALKVLKPGMDTRHVIARFEAERQALGIMEHPNIAKVFDGGTTSSGRPYFVMELVRGMPITEYCDQNHLTPRQRLELFIPVCQAVQHAHQKGIIHRDLKPSNVLVTLHDTRPVVKVIDFGVAKALGQELTDKTLFTGFAQMIGTPLYMSPEQAALSGLDVDTRSDIYSLGVLLYELLTGTTPFSRERFKKVAYDEMRRIIREEEPPKPSTRLSELSAGRPEGPAGPSSGSTLASVAALRQTEPAKLTKLVKGELDWIAMKCLEKDRNRRYETANGLAVDLQHYLSDEQVLACPPSAAYRLRKFVRRNKVALGTGLAVSAALVLAVVVLAFTTIWVSQERDEKAHALREREAALQEKDAALALATANEQTARKHEQAAKASALAAKAQEKAALASAQKAEAERNRAGSYFLEAASVLYRLADRLQAEGADQSPELEKIRSSLLEDMLGFYQNIVRRERTDPQAAYETARAYRVVGDIYATLGYLPQADEAYSNAIQALEKQVAEFPRDLDPRQVLATCHAHLAGVMIKTNRTEEAIRGYRRALVLWSELAVQRPHAGVYESSLIRMHQRLFDLLKKNLRFKEANTLWVDLLAPFEKAAAQFPADINAQLQLADAYRWADQLLRTTGRAEQASWKKFNDRILELYGKLPTETPGVLEDRLSLAMRHFFHANLLSARGRSQDAEKAYRHALALRGESPGFAADIHFHLAGLLNKQPDRANDVEDAYRRSLELYQRMLADSPTNATFGQRVAVSANNLSLLLNKTGRKEEGEKLLRASTLLWEKLAAKYPKTASLRSNWAISEMNLVQLLETNGQQEQAQIALDHVVDLLAKLCAEDPKNSSYQQRLSTAYVRLGRYGWSPTRLASAEKACTRLIEVNRNEAKYWHMRGDVYAELDDHVKAESDYAQAAKLDPKQPDLAYKRALLRLAAGDTDGYHKLCESMLKSAGQNSPAETPFWVSWTCVLAPGAVSDWQPVVQLAERALFAAPHSADRLDTLGAVLYRAGRFEEAAKRLTQAEAAFQKGNPGVSTVTYTLLFQIMVQHRLGHHDEAKRRFDQLDVAKIASGPTSAAALTWNRRVTLQMLHREAARLLAKEEKNR